MFNVPLMFLDYHPLIDWAGCLGSNSSRAKQGERRDSQVADDFRVRDAA